MSDQFLKLISEADPLNNERADVLLDTNVMLEIYSVGDLLSIGDKLRTPEAALRSPEYGYRLLRARHSTLLAWWLAKHRRIVGLLGNEVVDQLTRIAPKPGDGQDGTSYIFTTAIIHVVMPLVLRGWRAGPLTEVNHEAKGTKADTEILKQAASDNTPLITHEGLTQAGINDDRAKLRARAVAAGVKVFTAKEYLDSEHVDLDDESRQFLVTCRGAVSEAKEKRILKGHEVLDELEPLYRHILFGEVNSQYDHLPRA
jgi:hypothetical protein